MCGILTRGRGRKKGNVAVNGDPKQLRFRRRRGNNRSKKRQEGIPGWQIMRGQKAQAPQPSM